MRRFFLFAMVVLFALGGFATNVAACNIPAGTTRWGVQEIFTPLDPTGQAGQSRPTGKRDRLFDSRDAAEKRTQELAQRFRTQNGYWAVGQRTDFSHGTSASSTVTLGEVFYFTRQQAIAHANATLGHSLLRPRRVLAAPALRERFGTDTIYAAERRTHQGIATWAVRSGSRIIGRYSWVVVSVKHQHRKPR